MNETQFYYPELAQATPTAQLEIQTSFGGKWIVKSPTALPAMRGLKLDRICTLDNLVPQARHKVGWHVYTATRKAMEALRQSHTSSCAILLD